MSQLNLNLTPQFEKDLLKYMKEKGVSTKSEAIRVAIKEALEFHCNATKKSDLRELLGIGLRAPINIHPQFSSEDELWEKKK